ncbi:MAG: phenylalanine--tRNA ligase subunit beta, partial [Acidimicrobiia bacterium]
LAFFELGHVFAAPPRQQLLPIEDDHLAVVLTGTVRRAPVEPDRPVDVYDAVDALDALIEELKLSRAETRTADHPGFVPGRAASIVVDNAVIGAVGEIDPEVLDAFGAPHPAVGFELHLDPLLEGERRDLDFAPLSRFPAAAMDLAFVLDESVPARAVLTTLRTTGGAILEDVRVFDEFRSETLGAGRRSLAIALRFRAPDRTLTDAELTKVWQRCIDAVVKVHHAELRS